MRRCRRGGRERHQCTKQYEARRQQPGPANVHAGNLCLPGRTESSEDCPRAGCFSVSSPSVSSIDLKDSASIRPRSSAGELAECVARCAGAAIVGPRPPSLRRLRHLDRLQLHSVSRQLLIPRHVFVLAQHVGQQIRRLRRRQRSRTALRHRFLHLVEQQQNTLPRVYRQEIVPAQWRRSPNTAQVRSVARHALLRFVKLCASLGLRRAVQSRHRLIRHGLHLRSLHAQPAVAQPSCQNPNAWNYNSIYRHLNANLSSKILNTISNRFYRLSHPAWSKPNQRIHVKGKTDESASDRRPLCSSGCHPG